MSAAAATRSRMRLLRGLRRLAQWLPGTVLLLTPVAISYRYELISAHVLVAVVTLCAAGLGGLFTRSMLRGPDLLEASLRLDAAHQLKGRLAAALEFSGAFVEGARSAGRDQRDEDGYVSVVLKEAERLGPLSPQRAAPLLLPRPLLRGGLMLVFWGALFLV